MKTFHCFVYYVHLLPGNHMKGGVNIFTLVVSIKTQI